MKGALSKFRARCNSCLLVTSSHPCPSFSPTRTTTTIPHRLTFAAAQQLAPPPWATHHTKASQRPKTLAFPTKNPPFSANSPSHCTSTPKSTCAKSNCPSSNPGLLAESPNFSALKMMLYSSMRVVCWRKRGFRIRERCRFS